MERLFFLLFTETNVVEQNRISLCFLSKTIFTTGIEVAPIFSLRRGDSFDIETAYRTSDLFSFKEAQISNASNTSYRVYRTRKNESKTWNNVFLSEASFSRKSSSKICQVHSNLTKLSARYGQIIDRRLF